MGKLVDDSYLITLLINTPLEGILVAFLLAFLALGVTIVMEYNQNKD
jgi:hypothetical protein